MAIFKGTGFVAEVQILEQEGKVQWDIDVMNAKLNLDAIEIESKLAQCFSQGVGLWEETHALRVVKQKIESVNETIMNP